MTAPMDLKRLRTEHPEAYAAAVEEGVAQERDRVGAHLQMGEASGDLATAFEAIRNGSAMTQTLQSTYMAAGLRSQLQNATQSDSNTAEAATTGAGVSTEAGNVTLSEAVDLVVARRGGAPGAMVPEPSGAAGAGGQ